MRDFILGIFILLMLIGCTNDWLEEHSSNQLSADEQFDSKAGFQDALMGVYLGMGDSNLYGKDLTWNLVDILSQQYASFSSNATYSNIQEFKYGTSRATGQIDQVWAKAYNVIANINLALQMIEEKGNILEEDQLNIIKGELLGLRSLLHFDLIRLFEKGNLEERPELLQEIGLPYVKAFNKNIAPQGNYSDNFKDIEEDLIESISLLEESDPIATKKDLGEDNDNFYENREQRLNLYAVKALYARVLLWEGKLEEAKDNALDVIGSAPMNLIDSENYPVSSDRIFYQEILFALDREGLEDMIDNLLDASDNVGTNYDALYYNFDFIESNFETNNINLGIVDVRYNTLMETQSRGYVNRKLLQRGNANNAHNQIPLLKLSEMYYIAAEYYIKHNQIETGISYLNSVRKSRGIIEVIPDNITQIEALSELEKEYTKEFLSEGQLFFYYKRIGKEKISGVSGLMDDSKYVLPLPFDEIEFGGR